MVNPYFCYGFGFSIALLMYLAGWSDLYPPLSTNLISFVVVTIVAHFFLGVSFRARNAVCFTRLSFQNDRAAWLVTLFLFVLWTAEFFYEGAVPLIQVLLKRPYDYKLFGIPTLHVFIVTFSSFYTIFLFHLFLSSRSFTIFFLYLLNLVAAVLIYNRGMFLFNLSASAFLFFIHQGGLSTKLVGWGLCAMAVILFFFGVLGSLRVSNESRKPYSNEGFMQTGGANQRFRESAIPAEFFWTYIYTTSPMANLQKNVDQNTPLPLTFSALTGWLTNEILFDFISKRVNSFTGETRAGQKTIPGPFNASTVYSGSYSYLGWVGLALMAIFILALPVIFIKILPASSPFFLTALALLNTIFLFMIFENTIRFTGLSFQMVYPVLLNVGIGRVRWLKRIFSVI